MGLIFLFIGESPIWDQISVTYFQLMTYPSLGSDQQTAYDQISFSCIAHSKNKFRVGPVTNGLGLHQISGISRSGITARSIDMLQKKRGVCIHHLEFFCIESISSRDLTMTHVLSKNGGTPTYFDKNRNFQFVRHDPERGDRQLISHDQGSE
jgi:hypothetical protein